MKQIKVNAYPETESPKLFRNKFLELLTKTHPVVIDGMYVVLSYFSISHFYNTYHPSVWLVVGLFFTGFFSWSLAEYLMHRFYTTKLKMQRVTRVFNTYFMAFIMNTRMIKHALFCP